VDFHAFAKSWEDGWNSHDLDQIMRHYREDICFRSLKARDLVGSGEITGAPALRAYWAEALKRQPYLRFTVLEVFEGSDMCVLHYKNHRDVMATETLYFDVNGQVFQAAACHMR